MVVAEHGALSLIQQVRSGDYGRFLCIQLAPATARPALYATTAFHDELARIAEMVSEPLIGHIRLAWWREALDEIMAAKTPRNHPVVVALAQMHAVHPGILPLLYRIIEARAADLDTSLIAEESAWLDYCDNTAGALHFAWAMLLDAPLAKHYEVEIVTAGRAYAMVGLVRAIPFMHAQGWQRFAHAQIDTHGVESLAPSLPLNRMVQAIVMQVAKVPVSRLPHRLQPLCGLQNLNRFYCKKLAKGLYNPYVFLPSKLMQGAARYACKYKIIFMILTEGKFSANSFLVRQMFPKK